MDSEYLTSSSRIAIEALPQMAAAKEASGLSRVQHILRITCPNEILFYSTLEHSNTNTQSVDTIIPYIDGPLGERILSNQTSNLLWPLARMKLCPLVVC